jgi:hypothetical protein
MQVAAFSGSVGSLGGFARSEAAPASVPVAQEQPQDRDAYFSPVFKFDKAARVVVFQFRDGETGDVTRQYPSEKVVKLYRDGASIKPGPRGGEGGNDPAEQATAAPLPKAQPISSGSTSSSEPSKASAPASSGSERVSLTA